MYITEKVQFHVRGKPVGYTTHNRGARPSKAIIKYWDYLKLIRMCARHAGLELPIEADEEHQVMVKTRCYFPNRVHADPENVHKGAKDSLFHNAKKGDKYTAGQYSGPLYDAERPRLIITLEPYKAKKGKI